MENVSTAMCMMLAQPTAPHFVAARLAYAVLKAIWTETVWSRTVNY
jgi:hypothetical protein